MMTTTSTPAAGRLAAALADRYRIEREIGVGGMATVYLAEDLKHKRRVAMKVLKPELAAVLGADRFVHEIATTAALQHPHILPLFDSGTADGFLYYVMPFIDGETLRARLDRETQLAVDEAVRITRDVADALQYAHSHGIIHRDIKPENILLADGRPMVADFGIALAVSAAASGRMTETGLSLGTPHYMSPEQATAEKEITARSDVYSLGSVLYEMLTGNPPHTGASAQQIIMRIVTEDAAPVTKYRKAVPPNVAAAVAKSLEKLPADRFASAKEFADALGNPGFHGDQATTADANRERRRRGVLLGVLGAIALGFAAALVAVLIRDARPRPAEPRLHLHLAMDPGVQIGVGSGEAMSNAMRPSRTDIALSPDGSTLIFVGTRDSIPMLFLRPLGAENSISIAGTEGAESPVVSPDGKSVAFFARAGLRRVSLAGGPVTEIRPSTRIVGASWGDDDRIAVGTASSGIQIMSASGEGTVDSLGGRGAAHPQLLPGSRVMLFSMRSLTTIIGDPSTHIEAMNLDTRERRVVVKDGTDPRWLPPNQLIFVRRGTVMVVSFDATRMAVTGDARVVVDSVMQAFNGAVPGLRSGSAQLAISRSGLLAFIAGGLTPDRSGDARWLDREGHTTRVAALDSAQFNAIRISPNGKQVAVTTSGTRPSLVVYDIETNNVQPLAIRGNPLWPLWSPDGRRVLYSGFIGDSMVVMSSLADGSRPPVQVAADGPAGWPAFWSADGKEFFLLRTGGASDSGSGIVAVNATSGRTRPVANAPAGIEWPTLSPDGKSLAYGLAIASASRIEDVYVASWPAFDRQWKISSGGGSMPMWTKGGRELLFFGGVTFRRRQQQLVPVYAVSVAGDSEPRFSAPRRLFEDSLRGTASLRSFDATSDGSRILTYRVWQRPSPAGDIQLLVNWLH